MLVSMCLINQDALYVERCLPHWHDPQRIPRSPQFYVVHRSTDRNAAMNIFLEHVLAMTILLNLQNKHVSGHAMKIIRRPT